jgi:hypothetical protein
MKPGLRMLEYFRTISTGYQYHPDNCFYTVFSISLKLGGIYLGKLSPQKQFLAENRFLLATYEI